MRKFIIIFILSICTTSTIVAKKPQPSEVKNLIFMIGDGMGLAHVSMLMIENKYEPTAFDRAQNVALISTYSANNRVTDSAAAGTALATGHKTNNGTLGIAADGNWCESMITKGINGGMSTGVVVTCYLQHATPAAFYAHVASRRADSLISQQLITSGLDVAIGGGKAMLSTTLPNGKTHLTEFADKGYNIVYSLDELENISSGRVLALMANENMPKITERGDYLPRATEKALEILSKNGEKSGDGFILMVEGSQIDFAAHANDSKILREEVRDFAQAVDVAMDFADHNPGTLVVVTADHETGGLSIPSNHADFTESESGIRYEFGTSSHSATLVPVYLYGTGAERINGVMDNTELSKKIMAILGLK